MLLPPSHFEPLASEISLQLENGEWRTDWLADFRLMDLSCWLVLIHVGSTVLLWFETVSDEFIFHDETSWR